MTARAVPFDQRQRYEVAAALADGIAAAGGRPLRVLDVGGYFSTPDGGGALPVREFLGHHWTWALDRTPPILDRTAGYVRGDARALPFPAGTFDLACALDVLEHVAPGDRPLVAAELCRVSRGYVLVAAPFSDDGAVDAEAVLGAFVRERMGAEQAQLAEHAACGLPSRAELEALLPGGFGFGRGNLDRWLTSLVARYTALGLPHAGPALAALDEADAAERDLDSCPPFYRWFVAAPARGDRPDTPVAALAGRYPAGPPATPAARGALAAALARALARADPARLAAERAPLEDRVAQQLALLKDVEASMVYRLYRWLGGGRSGRP